MSASGLIDDVLAQKVWQAIKQSQQWAEKGWPVTFGRKAVVVSSLQQARTLSENELCREDALHYWEQVEQLGKEAAEWGKKAMEHLAGGNLQAAEDALYYARFIERPLTQYTWTWEPVHLKIFKKLKSHQK